MSKEKPSHLSVAGRYICPVPDYDNPPGGVPVLGIDFMAGPGPTIEGDPPAAGQWWERTPMPGLCACGHGLKPPHPGMKP